MDKTAGLENRRAYPGSVGSNPTPSASYQSTDLTTKVSKIVQGLSLEVIKISPLSIGLTTGLILSLVWISWNLTLDAWWQPTDRETIDRMLELLDLEAGDLVFDLGCGDGRTLTTAVADFDLRATGIEIDPLRVAFAWFRLIISGKYPRAKVSPGDMYKQNISGADGVLIFLSGDANEKLAPKFLQELDKGTRIVSYYHELPGWKPLEKEVNEQGYPIYLYEVGKGEKEAN